MLACSAWTASAQIPNGGFENWTDHGSYSEPTGWLTYNDVPTVGGPTVEAGTPGHPGSYYASITTRQSTGGVFAIQGWISAGIDSDHGGFPYSVRPAALTGQWQYSVQPGDTAQALVAFSRWNGTTAVTLGLGFLEVTGSNNNWQSFTVPINWFSGEIPDTAYIQIVSSINFGNPVVGSNVKVDDLAFSGSAGITDPSGPQRPAVQISRLGDQLLVTTSEAGILQFVDASGRALAIYPAHGTNVTLTVPELPEGVLIYRFISDDGKRVATGKWVRQ